MKKLYAILLVLLLASSWFASYFTLRLIDNVVVQNKLSVNELKISEKVTESLVISGDVLLKQIDIQYKLSLGYAAPFILEHDNDYYEVVDKPVNVQLNTSILKFVKVADSEKDDVAFIVSSLFQIYVHEVNNLHAGKLFAKKELTYPIYTNSNYSNTLSVAVPPPRV